MSPATRPPWRSTGRSPAAATLRTRADRRILADPTSTALLLAGPAALELCPGVRRVAAVADRVLVELTRGEVPAAASVRATPPRRTPTAYLTRFEWAGPAVPATTGELTLSYADGPTHPAHPAHPATMAVLTLDSEHVAESELGPADLDWLAHGFLANLAALAESRNRAA